MIVHLFCDESGAKGYSCTSEKYPGETGVFVALLFREADVARAVKDLSQILKPFTPKNGKFHITDLEPKDQGQVREQVLEYLTSNQVPVIFEAVYVKGFKEACSITDKCEGPGDSKVKFSETRPESLHVCLFQGLVGSCVAFVRQHGLRNGPITLKFSSDNVDAPVLKKFIIDTDKLLDTRGESILEVKGFDTETKKVITGSVSVNYQLPSNVVTLFADVGFTIVTETDDHPIIIAADIVANALNYHFTELQSTDLGCPLFSLNTFRDHPLKPLLYGLYNPDDVALRPLADTIYRYPQ